MLVSLSIECRLPVGVARCNAVFLSSLATTRPGAFWMDPWEPELPSRLVVVRSWCFLDLKRNAMVDCEPLAGGICAVMYSQVGYGTMRLSET